MHRLLDIPCFQAWNNIAVDDFNISNLCTSYSINSSGSYLDTGKASEKASFEGENRRQDLFHFL